MNNWCIDAVCSWWDYIWHIPYLILYKISPFGNILTYTLGTIISCLLASFSFRKNVSGIQTLVGSVNVRYLRCPFKKKEKIFFSSEMIKSHRYCFTMCVIEVSEPLIIPLFPERDLDTVFLEKCITRLNTLCWCLLLLVYRGRVSVAGGNRRRPGAISGGNRNTTPVHLCI